MKERILITIHSGEIPIFADTLRYVSNWCRENGLSEARVRNTEHGYEVFVPAATTPVVPATPPLSS